MLLQHAVYIYIIYVCIYVYLYCTGALYIYLYNGLKERKMICSTRDPTARMNSTESATSLVHGPGWGGDNTRSGSDHQSV